MKMANSYLFLILGTLLINGGVGLELHDSCDTSRFPSSSNPLEYDSYTRCDPRQGLYCSPQSSSCACYVVDSEYVDDTCRGKIGYPCKASPTFNIACGEHAICEGDSSSAKFGFCRCEDDFIALPHDKFNCNGTSTLTTNNGFPSLILFILLLLKTWIL